MAAFGTAVYILITIMSAAEQILGAGNHLISFFIACGALVSVGGGLWFTVLQFLVIHRICSFCTVIHLLAAAGAVAILSETSLSVHLLPEVLLASLAVSFLILTQVLFPARMSAVQSVGGDESFLAETEGVEGVRTEIKPSAPVAAQANRNGTIARVDSGRTVRLLGKRVVFEANAWPLIGDPKAESILALLMDFTCNECHHMHRLTLDLVKLHSTKIAVAVIPVPMHKRCNPLVKCNNIDQVYACAFARLAWALWLTDTDSFHAWDHYLHQNDECCPFGIAKLKASELRDISHFSIQDQDPVLDDRLAAGVALWERAGSPSVPALLLDRGICRGHFADVTALIELLKPYVSVLKEA